MAKNFTLILFIFALVALPPRPAQAQDSDASYSVGGPRGQLSTILYCGIGGAVLGLSTLSFYGRPQQKLVNIALGFAAGVIVGTGYVTYEVAIRPQSLYGDEGTTSELERDLAKSESRFARPSFGSQLAHWTF